MDETRNPHGRTRDSSIAWRKSSKSSSDGHCVEVAFEGDRTFVRDSKSAIEARLEIDREEWGLFIKQLKSDQI
jgi:hypothetical protein